MSNTVAPATTVRRAAGNGRSGERLGKPGVPERGSVDHAVSLSSGVWTTTDGASQIA